jgi:hypothetical protein
MGWLEVTRQGARGRVGEYALGIDRILADTKARWEAVGPDFALRMGEAPPAPDVVALPVRGAVPAPDISAVGTEWALAQALLHAEDAGVYGAWLRHLQRRERAGGRLTLAAPSRFHAAYVETHLKGRVLAACQAVDGDVAEVLVVACGCA